MNINKNKLLFILTSFTVLISFQNFDYVDWKNLKAQVGDLNENTKFVTPDSGSDLNSVAANWLEKEHRLIFGEWEQKWVDQLNESLFYDNRKTNPNLQTDLQSSTMDSTEVNTSGDQTVTLTTTQLNSTSNNQKQSKSAWRFKRINEISYHLSENSGFNCLVAPDASVNLVYSADLMANTQMRIKLSSKQNENAHFGIEHRW